MLVMSYIVMQDGSTHQISEDLQPIDCFRCGICCIRLRPKIKDEEIATISERLCLKQEIFIKTFTRVLPQSEERILCNDGKQCPFLHRPDENGRTQCNIYSFRPQACRNWQASLSSKECQEGLRTLNSERDLLKLEDIYSSQEEINKFNLNLNGD